MADKTPRRLPSRKPSNEWKPGILEDGLGVIGFDKAFDDHFQINSDLIEQALAGGFHPCCASFPDKKQQPEAWGMRVDFLWKLWLYIKEDLMGYAAAHKVDSDGRHYCIVSPCLWSHGESASTSSAAGAPPSRQLRQMRGDMHLVVQRYVMPWTRGFDAGLALVLNAGSIAWSRKCADLFCMATTFVSHSWSEAFEDFATTLFRLLDAQAVVWICSFALWQHGDVSASLSSLDRCPFAVSMRAAHRVLVLTDNSAETLERCWVVFEAALAHELRKDYNICLPDDGDADCWNIVGRKLEKVDVEACKASNEKDKQEILAYIRRQTGGITELNRTVRMIARQAMERAELMAAAVAGDLGRICRSSKEELHTWRNIRGRTVTHVAAACSQVAAMVAVLERTEYAHLNLLDEDSRSPLGVAVECGQIASVLALVALRANVELRAEGGYTALHLAAMGGHPDITQALVDLKGDLEAETVYNGRAGHRPLTIACQEGNENIVRLLVANKANMEARTSTGAAALHVAAWTGKAEAAAALLAGNAEVDITTEDMFTRTPLALALMNGHSTVVGLLLGAKADVSAQEESEDILTPAHTTRSRKRRNHKYSRKDSRRDSQILLQKHDSEKSSDVTIERRHSKRDSLTSEAAASVAVASIASMSVSHADTERSRVSRERSSSSHSVTFEEAADIKFFADTSSSLDEAAFSFNLDDDPGSDEESGTAVCFRADAPWAPFRRLGEWMALAFALGCLTGFLAHRLRR